MESEDIKINSKSPHDEHKAKIVEDASGEFMINDLGGGDEVLKRVKSFNQAHEEEVIYGVYDNSEKGFFVRMNDFFIDHSRITLKDKSYFFHMLAVMVDAGIPVIRSLKSLANRSQNQRFKRVLNTVAHQCESGATLADSMSRFESVFDESEIGIIRSGEATGRLDGMLFKLSAQLDKRHDLYIKLWGAAVYPIAVLSLLFLVTIGMLVWIFPTLLDLLKEGGVDESKLPFATRFLIGLQTAVVGYWWLILLVVFGIYGVFNMYVNSSLGAVRWDYTKLGMPIIGQMLRRVYILHFVSMLGILIDSGLPVMNALKITGNSIRNRVYKLKIQEVINDVKSGGKISNSLRDSEYLFSPEVVEMLAVGEMSASLGKISEKISAQYEREIDGSLKKMTSVFEPLMILVVGVFVALLALAIMAPIFNLSSTVGA